ncbi:hypothetical protein [Agaribacterium sp. ZY112]|uniref:hypothetical protein n=1 Tax=Agaribacterium sp. ZY112 TaxID=3233574 RepID=UPI003523A92C
MSILLSFLADLYIPTLALLYLAKVRIERAERTNQPSRVNYKKLSLYFFFGLIWIYGLGQVDAYFSYWHHWGMDYSRHSAMALLLLVALYCQVEKPKTVLINGIYALSLVIYALLMKHLGYHSLADVISTSAACLPILVVLRLRFIKNR